MPDRTDKASVGGLAEMQREDEKEPRGTNLVIALGSGSYSTQGFQVTFNKHWVCTMTYGPVAYYFRQIGF
jgi:hypothetical protein